MTPSDFQATLYRYLGVPLETEFTDQTGRPVPLLPSGKPIRELISSHRRDACATGGPGTRT